MKFGPRKTNYKRRAKNQLWKSTVGVTPATAKKRVKKKVNPIYGTELSGSLKPKKKIYNKVYTKSSFSIFNSIFKK